MKQPLGMTNNNPLNIRVSSSNWIGKVQQSDDAKFEKFSNLVLGLRAAFIVIKNYIELHRCDTPSAIIERWAPKSENQTVNYIKTVLRETMLKAEEKLTVKMKNKLCRLLWGMAFVEVGIKLSFALFETAYELAFNTNNKKKLLAIHELSNEEIDLKNAQMIHDHVT